MKRFNSNGSYSSEVEQQRSLKWNSSRFFEMLDFTESLNKILIKTFYNLGLATARHPKWFIIIPVLICLGGLFGLLRFSFIKEMEFYFPPDSQSFRERALIEHFFQLNSSNHFQPYYITRNLGYARILIEAKDKGSIFRQFLWNDILEIDKSIATFTINYKGKDYSYEDLCAKWNQKCIPNDVLALDKEVERIENGSLKLNYPMMISPLVLPMFFGGLTLDKDQIFIKSATGVTLGYFLKTDTVEDKERALLWERNFVSVNQKMSFNFLHLTYFSSQNIQDGVDQAADAVYPFTPVVAIIMILFSLLNTMMLDWVRSKFFLGFIGLSSISLAVIGSNGYLMLFGMPNGAINIMSPFLITGIGLDDMFVTLASWRRTNIQDSVEKRLSETYSDAGLSILITSLTNMASFFIGSITSFPAVNLFCIYSGTAVFMLFLVHMTFFGGCLVLFGRLEGDQRHSVCFKKVKAKSEIVKADGKYYAIWCAGGVNKKDPWNEIDNKPHYFMRLFRDKFGIILIKPTTKYCTLILFVLYICGSIYGIFHLPVRFEKSEIIRYDTHIFDFLKMEDSLFRHHAYNVQVMITGDIEYSNSSTRKMIMDLHKNFESLPFIASPALTISWMRTWFLRIKRKSRLYGNITDEKTFIKELRKTFRVSNSKTFDMVFNNDFSRIVASRFFIQTSEIKDAEADLMMMKELRRVASESPLNVTVFNPNFILIQQGLLVKPAMIKATVFAAVSMVIISLILIPNKWCSLYIGFAIISIIVGVVGFMSLWGVTLNLTSTICILISIGFSVDFTAHISYSYCSSKCNSSDEKIRNSLYCLGLPILQGGLSTICSIIIFVIVPSYVFLFFFKVIFLVVVFSMLHGLVFVPVLLSVTEPQVIRNFLKRRTGVEDKYVEKSNHESVKHSESDTNRTSFDTIETVVDDKSVDKNNINSVEQVNLTLNVVEDINVSEETYESNREVFKIAENNKTIDKVTWDSADETGLDSVQNNCRTFETGVDDKSHDKISCDSVEQENLTLNVVEDFDIPKHKNGIDNESFVP